MILSEIIVMKVKIEPIRLSVLWQARKSQLLAAWNFQVS